MLLCECLYEFRKHISWPRGKADRRNKIHTHAWIIASSRQESSILKISEADGSSKNPLKFKLSTHPINHLVKNNLSDLKGSTLLTYKPIVDHTHTTHWHTQKFMREWWVHLIYFICPNQKLDTVWERVLLFFAIRIHSTVKRRGRE